MTRLLLQRLAAGFRATNSGRAAVRSINGGQAGFRSARGKPALRSSGASPRTHHRRPARLSGRCAAARRGEPGLRSTGCPAPLRHRWRARLSGRFAAAGRGKPGLRSSAALRAANRRRPLASAAALAAALLLAAAFAAAAASGLAQDRRELRPVSAFAGIADPAQRSVTLFEEAGKVLLHPRCVNCHPAGDRPTQGDDGHPHQPRVTRGPDGHGVTAMRCQTCHQAANFNPGRVPGNPKWALAPIEMAWQGQSLGEICAQIRDPARNGGHPLAEIVEHMGHDPLVGWGWAPDTGREPAPGTQAALGELIAAWVESGAACPGR